MEPQNYFTNKYIFDLNVFLGHKPNLHGPQWMLCGMTFGNILEPEKYSQYSDVSSFIYIIYSLNLINQGIHEYFPEDFSKWCLVSIAFPDCQACPSHHGGIMSPDSILTFAKNPSYIPKAKHVHIKKQELSDYLSYIFNNYLAGLVEQHHFKSLNVNSLIEKLKHDPDCHELPRTLCN